MTETLLIAAVFFMNSANLPAGNVQAESASSMKKMYKKHLTRRVSGKNMMEGSVLRKRKEW